MVKLILWKRDTIVLARHNYAGGEAMKQMQLKSENEFDW
jgi:hypothetical protein